MRWNIYRRTFGFIIAALAIGVGGCGSPHFDVTGKVTYNGKPLDKPDGQISFVGPKGELVVAAIGPDGSYNAPHVPGGLNRVSVSYPNPKAKRDRSMPKLKPGETPPPGLPPFLIPEKYAAADTSELSVTVDKETVYNVDLSGPPIP
jgi:hypothetical protein